MISECDILFTSEAACVVARACLLWIWLKITWVELLCLTLKTLGPETGTISVSLFAALLIAHLCTSVVDAMIIIFQCYIHAWCQNFQAFVELCYLVAESFWSCDIRHSCEILMGQGIKCWCDIMTLCIFYQCASISEKQCSMHVVIVDHWWLIMRSLNHKPDLWSSFLLLEISETQHLTASSADHDETK